ncbi:MAG TPA: YraN family protein [Bacteroidia bacterium]
MAEHNDKGKEGETEALRYLKGKGYFILEVNWRVRKLEADIIAMDKNRLVFVEVKTRADNKYGEPELAVTKKKQRNLIQLANEYIELRDYNGESRFDIISVLDEPDGTYKINHIEDAFYPLL